MYSTQIDLELQKHSAPSAPNLFEYDNYRRFLKDYYVYEKARNKAFSLRYFSKRAGYRASCFLKFVMDGKRNLTAQGIVNFSRALKLTPTEASFFASLVRLNQAKTPEDRQHFAGEILRSKTYIRLNPLAQAKFEYWSKWYHIAIREMAALQHFRADPAWISAQLRPRISPAQAAAALETLQILGLLRRDADGKLTQTQEQVTSGDEVVNACVSQFHRDIIEMGIAAIDRFAKPKRQITGLTLGLNEETEKAVRERLTEVRKEILAMVSACTHLTKIVQVNFQMFPLTGEGDDHET